MDKLKKKSRQWRESLDPSSAAKIAVRIAQSESTSESDSKDRDPGPLPCIKGYEIHESLGQGASGRVYLAVRQGSERPVAIKLYSCRFDAGPHAQRATRELDLLGDIRHPNIVRLLDYGVHDSSLWIATEFINAAPLDEYCAQHALSTRQRVELLSKVCDAVQGLHEFGVIHRDLKPSNILIDENGQPTIIDLGIASLMGGDATTTLTQEGTPIGTPAFMAPEQARGERALISTRSDVYSLGAIGYLLLAGDTPHPGDATIHELIRRVAQDEPRDARAIEPAIPKRLAAVLGKAVRRQPAGRYPSSAELGTDLRRWVAGEHVAAVRPGPWTHASRWVGRHPIVSTALISLALSLGIIGGGFGVAWWLNQTPAYVRILDGGRKAVLHARSGNQLHDWRSDEDEGVKIARIIDRPKEFGGGRAILTVIHGFVGDAELDGQLCLWDIDDPSQLIWSTSAAPPFIKHPGGLLPPSTSDDVRITPESYVVGRYALVADVFAESPGNEIVVVHSHAYDPQAIRVYSTNGRVLYEAWHWGAVTEIYWIEDPGVLVCGGRDNEVPWSERGYPEVKTRFPYVIFAVKPEMNRHLGWINGPGADAQIDLRWYKYLWLPETVDQFDVFLRAPRAATLRGSSVQVELRVVGTDARVWWTVNGEGEPMLPKPSTNDPFKELADPPAWEFVGEIPDPPGWIPIDEHEPDGG